MRPNDEHIDYDLLARYILEEADELEIAEVSAWLEEDPGHSEILNDLKKTMDLADELKSEIEVDTEAAWSRMKQHMQEPAEQYDKRGGVFELTWPRLLVAAVFMGLLLSTAVWLSQNSQQGEFIALYSESELLTETLPDGSVITLNENSTLEYAADFTENRSVILKGEAFFDVARDEEHPFVIQAGDIEVEVLGTSFNVKAFEEDAQLEVTVETGLVKVSEPKGEFIEVKPGKRATYDKLENLLSESEVAATDHLYWRLQKLVFTNTELREVIEILNEQFDARIQLEDPSSAACRFTASFEDDSLETILAVLTATFNLDLIEAEEHTILKGKACEIPDL